MKHLKNQICNKKKVKEDSKIDNSNISKIRRNSSLIEERGKLWLIQKEHRLNEQREKVQNEEIEKCTFHPDLPSSNTFRKCIENNSKKENQNKILKLINRQNLNPKNNLINSKQENQTLMDSLKSKKNAEINLDYIFQSSLFSSVPISNNNFESLNKENLQNFFDEAKNFLHTQLIQFKVSEDSSLIP